MTINTSISEDAMTDEIPLSPTPLPSSAATPKAEEVVVEDVTENDHDDFHDASDDNEVNALLDELDQVQQTSDQQKAVQKLAQSTANLKSALFNISSDIDSKLSISEKASDLNQNLGITRTASSTASTVSSFLSNLQLQKRAMDVVNSDTVQGISHSLSDTLEKTGVKGAVVDGSQKLKQLDEDHRISVVTAETLAGGVNFVADGLNRVIGKSKDEQDE
jgi:molecular chaperone GrpE (heat shock protein)